MSHGRLCRLSDGKRRALDLVVCHAVGFSDCHARHTGICPDLLPAHHSKSMSRHFQHTDRHWCGRYPLCVSLKFRGKRALVFLYLERLSQSVTETKRAGFAWLVVAMEIRTHPQAGCDVWRVARGYAVHYGVWGGKHRPDHSAKVT